METSNIYIYVYVYIDKVIIVDNRLCLCHYAFCFLHMKCVCVCVRAWVGGRVVVFTKYGWKKFTRNTRQNGVSSPALMADVMRWNWVEEVAGRSSHPSRLHGLDLPTELIKTISLHWGPSHIHIVRINHPPRYLWLSKWWFLNSHSFLGIYKFD